MKSLIHRISSTLFGYQAIPIVLSILSIIIMPWNFFSAFLIFKSFTFTDYIPSISEYSGKFPERLYFGLAQNFVGYLTFFCCWKRLKYTKSIVNPIISIVFVITACIAGFSASFVSICSMFDDLWIHNISALTVFLSLLVLIVVWYLQDIILFIKKDKLRIPTWLFIIRGISVVILSILMGITFILMIIFSVFRQDRSFYLPVYNIFAVFEHIYVIGCQIHNAFNCVDMFIIQKKETEIYEFYKIHHKKIEEKKINVLETNESNETEEPNLKIVSEEESKTEIEKLS